MKQFKIVYLPIAVGDLKEIFRYISQDKPKEAQKWVNKMDQNIAMLSHFPYTGIIPKDPYLRWKGYHILIIENYLVLYLIKKQLIEIQRILHHKRRYQLLL